MAVRTPQFSHDALLDAAEAVIHEHGIATLTLDAVAARAGVSKGGLMYHFRSKDLLLEAMVTRIVARWKTDADAAIDRLPKGPGRVARGVLSICLEKPDCGGADMRRSGVVLVTALASNPALIKPLREAHTELLQRAEKDGLEPGASATVILALSGLWFERIFGLSEMTPKRRQDLLSALRSVASSVRKVKRPRRATSSRTRKS